MSAFKDLSGNKYGRLTVIERSHGDGKHTYWKCHCECGNQIIVCGDSLKRGATRSCGCLNSEMSRKKLKTHGKSAERVYKIWLQMKYRCSNKNATGFKYWGGKGIKVCEEWQNSFEKFYCWAILNGYRDDLTIDRINSNGNYEPTNCQWLTKGDNSRKALFERKFKKNDFGVNV